MTLAQGRIGPVGLWVMAVVASSPLTVQVGGIPTMYAATGVAGVPLAFVLVAGVLYVIGVGYAGAVGHMRHAAPLYALMGRGLSPVAGVAAGVCALMGYLAIGTSLYGLLGMTIVGLFGVGQWWVWALGAMVVVAGLGLLGGLGNVGFLGFLLAIELAVIVFYIVTALTQRAAPLSFESFAPSALLVPGMAGTVAFAMAAFVGVETVPAYAEEARGGATAVRRAMLAAIGFAGAFYAIGAWAMSVHAGPGGVAQIGSDASAGPLQTLSRVFGPAVGALATMLMATSVVAAMSSFHQAGVRYLFAMAREAVLPGFLASTNRSGETPLAASLSQTALAGVVIAGFALLGADPLVMFTWLSTLGAVTLLALLVVASAAAHRFFATGQGGNDSVVVRRIAPATGFVLGLLLMVMMLANLGSLLGLPPGSSRWLLLPTLVGAVLVAGLVWGGVIWLAKPAVLAGVGRVVADPVSSPVRRLGRMVM
ncbi:APC family permease [Catellatospora citrea]|uniref:APC family permease n=1 Tax=Catellatospora citrea TaxID=53366 RepID=UPI0014776C3F|nr:APC family permease [Catellatospora citrea]